MAIGGLAVLAFVEALLIARLIFMGSVDGLKERVLVSPYMFSDITFSNEKTPDERRAKILQMQSDIFDSDFGLVGADGTWLSDAELANDFNTVSLECWKTFNHCFASQAEINDFSGGGMPFLYLGTEIYEITKWGLDEIKATSGTAFGCFEYELTLDRVNQKVTSVRKQTSTDGMCEGTSDKPLMIYLGSKKP